MAVVHDPVDINFSSDQHDIEYNGSMYNLNPSTSGLSVTGIDPYGRALPGTEIILVNVGSDPITLKHNGSGSTAGNRLWFTDNNDQVLGSKDMVWAIYKEVDLARVGWWVEIP